MTNDWCRRRCQRRRGEVQATPDYILDEVAAQLEAELDGASDDDGSDD